jgi:hypothetical protein
MRPLLPDHPIDLGAWVLDHGLPALPPELDTDEAVAIARWSGEEYGAVLYVSSYVDEEEGESGVDTDVQTYRRVGGSWVASEGSGGGGWFDQPFERPDIGENYAAVLHVHSMHGPTESYCAAYGVAGRGAAFVEVLTATGSAVAPLDSPVGAFVVAADGGVEAFVRVLDSDQRVLTEKRFAPAMPAPTW